MKGLKVVFGKEIRESLRDRRSVTSALVMGPLFGPALFAAMMIGILSMEQQRAEEALEVPVVGAEHAPNLVEWLGQQNIEIQDPPENPERAVRDNDEAMVLVIPEAFGERLGKGEPAVVEVIYDRSRRETDTLVDRLKGQLNQYGRLVGALRLQARGVNPNIVRAVVIKDRDISTPESRGALVLGMMPYFLMFAVFMGGMYLAIDTTAGERERQSLEPLLLNPVPRGEIMAGKLAATIVFALISLALTVTAFAIAMRFVPVSDLGLGLALDVPTCLRMFVFTAPMAVVAGGMQTIVAAFAKSFREAQTYLSFLLFVPMLPTLALFILPIKAKLWMMSIPILSQSLLIQQLVRDEIPEPMHVAVSVVTTLVLGALLALVAGRLYHSERLAFSGS